MHILKRIKWFLTNNVPLLLHNRRSTPKTCFQCKTHLSLNYLWMAHSVFLCTSTCKFRPILKKQLNGSKNQRYRPTSPLETHQGVKVQDHSNFLSLCYPKLFVSKFFFFKQQFRLNPNVAQTISQPR